MRLPCLFLASSLATVLASPTPERRSFTNPFSHPCPLDLIFNIPPGIPARGTPTTREVSSVQENVSLCSQYAYYAANGYEVLNNLWGKDQASSGSQCTYYEGSTGSGIKWSSTWQWTGGENQVKSYVYAGKILSKGNLISNVRGMPTSIQWSYDTNNVRANVAYDIFTASDPNHVNSSGDYELMIW